MQLTDIITRVQRIFGDEDEVQISVEDIISWVSDAQMEVARQTEILTKSKEYDYDPLTTPDGFLLPTDFILEKRVTWSDGTNIRSLGKTTLTDLDGYMSNPQGSENSDVVMYYLWGGNIYPWPQGTRAITKAMKLWYVCCPDPLNQTTDQLQIPQYMHEDLVRYALMRARELNEDVEQAQAMNADLTNRLVQSRSEAFNPYKDQYPVIRDYAGDQW